MENLIDWDTYLKTFDTILSSEKLQKPYDNPTYLEYVKLNKSRQKRWLKTVTLDPVLIERIKAISSPQSWYLITEPWCGDAAHSVPFIKLMSDLNSFITLKIVWRDTAPFMIDNYLTNGGKSIPKLVVRDENEEDVFVWGPRPEPCQKLFLELKNQNISYEEQKVTLQNWYNTDKGITLQKEFLSWLKSTLQT